MANANTSMVGILGMECDACTRSVERAVGDLHGVLQVSVSLDDEEARISYDSSLVDEAAIRNAILELGFDIQD